MVLLVLLLVPILLLLSFWYVFISNDSEAQARLRNILPVQFENLFLMFSRRRRFELLQFQAIKRLGSKVFGCNLLGSFTIFIAEPELISLVLAKEFTNFPKRRDFPVSDPAFEDGLTFAPVAKWKRLRSILTPAFSAGKIRLMKPHIDGTLQGLLKNMDDLPSGSTIDLKQYLGSFTMDSITRLAFGLKIDSLLEADHPISVNAKKMLSFDLSWYHLLPLTVIMTWPRLASLLKIRFAAESIDFFTTLSKKIISEKKAEPRDSGQGQGKGKDFITMMLELEEENKETPTEASEKPSKYMTESEVISSAILFFLGGFDTVSSTISLALYSLALNPEIQERLYLHIETTLATLSAESSDADLDRFQLVTIDTLHRFDYLTACLNESMRLYPAASFTERQAIADTVLASEDGQYRVQVKKGDVALIPIWSIHRDETQFPAAERFNPDRFMGSPRHHRYAFLPFGSGPRSCVAKFLAELQAKLAFLHVVRQYRFSPCKETLIPMEFFNTATFAMIPKDVRLKIEKR